jgi:hypothetical protein
VADTSLNIIVKVIGTSEAGSEVQVLSKDLEGVGTASEESSKKASAFGGQLKALAVGFAVFKGFQFLKDAVSTTTDLAKSTAQLQRVTGLDTQTAAGWAATAEERGISTKVLAVGMATLGRNMQGVAKGSSASIQAFQALGISQKQLASMNTQQTLGAIADGLAKMPPGAEKAAAAQKLLGRSGTQLLPILNNGSKALNEQIDTMGKQTGITKGNLQQGLAMAKQQRELSAAMLGLKVAVGTALIPILSQLAKVMLPIMQGFAKLLQSSPVLRYAIIGLTAAVVALNIALAVDPFVLIAAGVAALIVALIVAYNKVAWFRNAVNAVFDFIKKHWMLLLGALIGPVGVVIAELVSHWQDLRNGAVAAFNAIKSVAGTIAGAVSKAWTTAFSAIKSGLSTVGKAFSTAFGIAEGAIKSAINAVISGWNSLQFHIPSVHVGPVHFGGGTIGVPKIPLLAQGGYMATGGLAIVGERGPELVSLPGGSTVYPNGTGVIHTHVYLRDREIAHAIGQVTADRQAAR